MLQFKAMYNAAEKEIKEAAQEALEKVYRPYRKELRALKKEGNMQEIMDIIELEMLTEEESIHARKRIFASVNILAALYEYNMGKIKYFAEMHKCETLVDFIELNENDEKLFSNSDEQFIFNKVSDFLLDCFVKKVMN